MLLCVTSDAGSLKSWTLIMGDIFTFSLASYFQMAALLQNITQKPSATELAFSGMKTG